MNTIKNAKPVGIDEVKALFGEERLKRLAEMPYVKDRHGLEAHLAAACAAAGTPQHAVVIAIRQAGGKPSAEDMQAFQQSIKALLAEARVEVKSGAEPLKAANEGKPLRGRSKLAILNEAGPPGDAAGPPAAVTDH